MEKWLMQFGIHIPPFGPLSDVQILAELAAEAEQAGWDGFFLWDDVTFAPPIPVGDPWRLILEKSEPACFDKEGVALIDYHRYILA
jgi:hypothetical protein